MPSTPEETPDLARQRDLFDRAMVLPAGDREAFVRRKAADDSALLDAVLHLLAHEPEPTAPLAQAARIDPPTQTRPDQIGPYKILEELGEGGMGTVYKAEQREPVRRLVAIKVVRQGLATKDVLARFALERRALAAMSHNCIAKVFDAGATDDGQPYFVMELVEGLPVTEYCDKHKLSLPDRLKLFQQICSGVQHAHLKGVIHRDLKPGNVLVTRDGDNPVPKILDFGLAKATNRDFLEATLFTEKDQILGTPEYMSPEQATGDGEVIDARTDIYSLGVMLYELLTGELPFTTAQLRKAGVFEALRLIRESEPPKPSTRLTTSIELATASAGKRRISTGALSKALRGDLDWIVMQALAKEPERRYDAAASFAADVKRYLAHEPVLAGPPTVTYRLRKFVRKHRAAVLGGGLLILTVLAGGIISTIFWKEASREREKASGLATDEAAARKRAETALAEIEAGNYRNQIALARRLWLEGEPGRATAVLDTTRPEDRGPEWGYFQSVLHDSIVDTELAAGFAVAFSPSGGLLATSGPDNTVLLHDTRTWAKVRRLEGHTNPVERIVYSGDGNRLATIDRNRALLWEESSSVHMLALSVDNDQMMADVSLDRSGRTLVRSTLSQASIIDVATGQERQQLPNYGGWISIDPTGKHIVGVRKAGLFGGFARLTMRNLTSGLEHDMQSLPEYPEWVFSVGAGTVDRSSSLAMRGGALVAKAAIVSWAVGGVQMYSPSTRRFLRVCEDSMGQRGPVAVSSDGTHIAGVRGRTVRIWKSATGALLRRYRLPGDARCVALSRDGSLVAATCEQPRSFDERGRLLVWDTRVPQGFRLPVTKPAPSNSVAFSPDGRRLAIAGVYDVPFLSRGSSIRMGRRTITLPRALEGVVVADLETREQQHRIRLRAPSGHQVEPSASYCVAWSPEGSFVAIGTPWGTVEAWRPGDEQSTASWTVGKRAVGHLNFRHEDGALVASDGDAIAVIDMQSRVVLARIISSQFSGATGIIPGPSAHRVVATGSYTAPIMRDATSGTELFQIPRGRSNLVAAFHPDGRRIAVMTVEGGRAIAILDEHGETDHSVSIESAFANWTFTPDGTRLVVVTGTSVDFWELDGLVPLFSIEIRAEGSGTHCVFSRDGAKMAVVDRSGVIVLNTQAPEIR